MGYWVGKDNRRFYVEGNIVSVVPGGYALPLDPATLESIDKAPEAPAKEESPVEPEPKNVLSEYTDESKVDSFVKEGKNVASNLHSKGCTSLGRGGRYTDGCPKCQKLSKGK